MVVPTSTFIFLLTIAIALSQPINVWNLAIQECNGNPWSIHGLWPQYNWETWPSFCNTTPFDVNALNPIISQMNTNWFSCSETNNDFWSHEWYTKIVLQDFFYLIFRSKHGTCSGMDQLTYFSQGLKVFQNAISNQYYGSCTTESYVYFDQNYNFVNASC
jgi:hypothetical protein